MENKRTGKGHCITKDFLPFNFSNEEDIVKMLELDPWFLGVKGLIIKRQHKGFRPETENLYLVPVWISLLNLPIEFWNMNIIAGIAKVVKTLVSIDNPTKTGNRMMEARFYVNAYVSKDLLK